MPIVDHVESGLGLGVHKVEVLADGVVLVHILGGLDPHVQLVTIHEVGDGVAKVLNLVHPR